MSENLDLVLSIYADWEHGDFTHEYWAAPDLEYVEAEEPAGGEANRGGGLAGLRGFLSGWHEYRLKAVESRELDAERVLVLDHGSGRQRVGDLEMGQAPTHGARVFTIRDLLVRRIVVYFDRDRAFADLGLEE
jgi:hypothetical protein